MLIYDKYKQYQNNQKMRYYYYKNIIYINIIKFLYFNIKVKKKIFILIIIK